MSILTTKTVQKTSIFLRRATKEIYQFLKLVSFPFHQIMEDPIELNPKVQHLPNTIRD
jgi:hypothetical protein